MNKFTPVVLIAAVLFVGACSKDSDSKILAKVNGGKITIADFKKQLDELPPQMRQVVATDAKARKDFLEDLVGIELVLQEARRQGLHKDADFKKRQEQLKKDLQRKLEEDYKNELFNTLLRKQLADKISALAPPTDQAVRDFYSKNKKIMQTANGKTLGLKEVEPQIKSRLMQEKQRELYIDFTKELKAKAKIKMDDKAMDALAATLATPTVPEGMQLDHPALKNMGGK
jgi:peptidyl-prolyl cis-trans isomerase C